VTASERQFEAILSESVEHASLREREAFDQLAGPFAKSIVLYGAGNLGRNALRALRKQGMEPLAFSDANPALSGTKIEGVAVFSPRDAVAKFGRSAVFVVCIWHPERRSGVQQIVDTLTGLGAEVVSPFILVFWKYAELFLPHYFWDLPSNHLSRRVDLHRAFEMLADEESKRQFVADLDLRVNAKFLSGPVVDHGRQYFPRSLFRISPDECFVDCGAYDGDTIKDLVRESGGAFKKVIAFEADPANFSQLQQFVSRHPQIASRVLLRQEAVGRSAGTVRFAATASANASVSRTGETVVKCVALDDVLASEKPTMIKMDVEGSELDALQGAESTIKKHQPLLAICAYHRPADLCEIPFALKGFEPESRLYLRSYAMDGFDTVSYAAPLRAFAT